MPTRRDINAARKDARAIFDARLSRRAMVRQLGNRGWRSLGRGMFATVMKHADYPTVVIKVAGFRSKRLPHMLDGFAVYVRWLQDNKVRSKHAPKIYEHLGEAHDEVTITVIERLKTNRDQNFTTSADYYSVGMDSGSLSRPARRFIDRIRGLGYLDIHDANIMQRADGTPVFSDPLLLRP